MQKKGYLTVSVGTNNLIKKGIAKMVTEPEDILGRARELKGERVKVDTELNPPEKEIYELIKSEEMSVDEIAVALSRDLVDVSTTVSMMALKGIISEARGKYFVV